MVSDGGGVNASATVGILEVQLRLPGKAVADLLPVYQVLGMINRHSREILESTGYQIVIISDAADAGIGIEARDDGVGITKLLRLGGRSNTGYSQNKGKKSFLHVECLFCFLAI